MGDDETRQADRREAFRTITLFLLALAVVAAILCLAPSLDQVVNADYNPALRPRLA